MKKCFISVMICVIFSLLIMNVNFAYAYNEEMLYFSHGDRIFTYTLSNNIKSSSQYDLNYKINKYSRFSSTDERKKLLSHMLSIGLSKEVALNYLFPNLSDTISIIEKNIFISPVDASLSINPNTEKVFYIKKEKNGIQLNKDELYDIIINNYLSNKSLHINIPTITLTPRISAKEYQNSLYLRGDFSTNISLSNSDRKHNIKNALNSLNKIEIYPNEIFSFNKVVGRRTEENGYRNAKIIVNNEFVDGIGGGVCQVSSTLYNSALLAGLKIIEANKHSKQVHYVKNGFDAMVNFGSSDLRFQNNTNEKITIITNYSNDNIRIRLFGDDMQGITYRLNNEITNIVKPSEEILYDDKLEHTDKVIYEDESFYLKQACTGMDIVTYRDKYQNNKFLSREVLRKDIYKPQNAVVIYGTKKREESTPSHLQDIYNLHSMS